MEKLYFYVLKYERMIPKYLAEAIEDEYLISPCLRAVLEDTTYYIEPVTENDLIPDEEEEAYEDSESDDKNNFDYGVSEGEGSNYTCTGIVARGMRLWFHRRDKICY